MPAATQPMDLTAVELSRAIHARQVSCREVMEACLARVDRLNPTVNALVSLRPRDELLAEADARDAMLARGQSMGWMHGFPAAPKDISPVAGMPTTSGSPFLKDVRPAVDGLVMRRMREAGAIFIARSNVPEFGLGSHTYNTVFGTTGNAWNPERTAGGSSGGAAVALALNMMPVADGSDVMGSLRNPAGWNNIYGMRPSQGRVPTWPADDGFYQQLGTEGPMARTVADLAMLLSVQAGYDRRTPLAIAADGAAFAQPLARDVKGTRIGWLGDFDGHLATGEGVMDLLKSSLAYFDTLGCQVDAARPDYDMARLWQCWLTLRGFFNFGRLKTHYDDPARRARMKPEAVWEVESGLNLTVADVVAAGVSRSAWRDALLKLFERFDFLVLPTAQVFPFDARETWPREIAGRAMDTYHRWMEVVIGPTLAGLPAISVPAGFSADGLPMGLQIVGPPQADFALLQMAHAWEEAVPFGQREPALLAAARAGN